MIATLGAPVAPSPKSSRPFFHNAQVSQDDQPLEDVRSALGASGYVVLTRVEVFVVEGVVMLSGVLPSYYMKQVAQTVVRKLEWVRRIENRCQVRYPWPHALKEE
jgi:osmotically-inducible protein OsmY